MALRLGKIKPLQQWCLRVCALEYQLPAAAGFRTFKMTARQRSEKVLEQMKESNPYFEKYAKKIASVQKSSPEEFLARLDSVKKEKSKSKFGPVDEQARDYSGLLNPKAPLSADGKPIEEKAQKKLEDIMKVELVAEKSAAEVGEIWLKYHQGKEALSAAIPREQYDLMIERARKYPIFILPIPRSQGYEFMLLQFFANTVHFTPLINYQVHKENAPECLNLTLYTELRGSHGLVLMRGEYDSKVLNAQEAQCLANQLQMYYSQQNKTKLALLEKFTCSPDQFKHMDVIEELNNLKIGG
ncbi:ATP synthase mitochondrial F1 complex assembly factor 1 [Uranotaenia lowii]|uniref:ATP synthase mitochondrial F1 complex assembly factor 1 n=1 Tax=Uranotaenia lowii TaxID=190385 RepID=UPI002478CC23|nr:ATP synthase mitochondrial F1 complex assembly factor 1 [Uranotaenia lowii]